MLKLILLSLALVAVINGQSIDKTFCDPATIVPAQPQLPFDVPADPRIRYQMSMEINSGLTRATTEMDQFYDGFLNRAVDIIRAAGEEFRIYTYPKTDEVILVSRGACIVQQESTSTLSPIGQSIFNGSEHIISPLQLLHQQDPSLKEVYIGKADIKGVKVNQWQMCNFNQNTKVTQRITYSLSDPDVWVVAQPFGNRSAVPVEVRTENKFPNGTTWTEVYSITKFLPYIRTYDELWQTPSGVYCPGRKSTKPTPKLPQGFALRAQIVTPIPLLDDLIGGIRNIREVYDYKQEQFRLDYSTGIQAFTEIHDYKTGLRYIIDRFHGNCTTTVIDPESFEAQSVDGFVTMKNTSAFFDFDGADFQYSGQRHVDHINCDTWIGNRKIGNTTTLWEWYFMAPGYIDSVGVELEYGEPVLLIITFDRVIFNNVTQQYVDVKVPVYYYFYNFDESGIYTFDFDITPCTDNLPKKHFTFELPTDYRSLMEQYKLNLKLGVLIGITTSCAVYPSRVTELEIDFNEDNIVVVFTLLEKSPFYGNVQRNLSEVTLHDASILLNATVMAEKLLIPFIIDKDRFFDLVVPRRSFREIEARGAGLIYVSTINKNTGYSGGAVAAITIVMIAVGAGLGVLIILAYKLNYFDSLLRKIRVK